MRWPDRPGIGGRRTPDSRISLRRSQHARTSCSGISYSASSCLPWFLNIVPLGSPYRLIAADANRSNSVTTFDLVEIRKLILQINSDFPNNTSWRFVDGSYQFPNPANPWTAPFPEVININDLPTGSVSISCATLGQPRARNPGATNRGVCLNTAATSTRSAVSSASDSLRSATFMRRTEWPRRTQKGTKI